VGAKKREGGRAEQKEFLKRNGGGKSWSWSTCKGRTGGWGGGSSCGAQNLRRGGGRDLAKRVIWWKFQRKEVIGNVDLMAVELAEANGDGSC